NSRSLWVPLMTVAAGPAPAMVTESVTSKSPAAFVLSLPTSVWVYVPALSTIVSGPGLALARLMAWRSVSPLVGKKNGSSKRVTRNVAGTARASSASTTRRFERRSVACDVVGRTDQNRADMTRLLAAMLAEKREWLWLPPPSGAPVGCDGKWELLW